MEGKIAKNTTDLNKFTIALPVEANLISDCSEKQSTLPGIYKLSDRTFFKPCYQEFPGYNIDASYGPNLKQIDIDSEFRGLNYLNSKCPDPKTDPIVKFRKSKSVKTFSGECDSWFVPEYTKNHKSCESINVIQQNRFEFPLYEMKVQSNSYIGENTRLLQKDLEVKKEQSEPKKVMMGYTENCGQLFGGSVYSQDCSNFKKN